MFYILIITLRQRDQIHSMSHDVVMQYVGEIRENEKEGEKLFPTLKGYGTFMYAWNMFSLTPPPIQAKTAVYITSFV